MAYVILEVPAMFRSSFSLGDLNGAEEMIQRAIRFDKNFILNYVTLADIYMKQNKKNLAKEQLKIALNLPIDPDYIYAPENRRDKKAARRKIHEYFDQ